ncbi:MAG: hypothetical protein AABY07_09615 [Nanoarchaeota archaeon]
MPLKITEPIDELDLAINNSISETNEGLKINKDNLIPFSKEDVLNRLAGLATKENAYRRLYWILREALSEEDRQIIFNSFKKEEPQNGELRLRIISNIIGDENTASRIVEINKNLLNTSTPSFKSYSEKLKNVIREIHRDRVSDGLNPKLHPEKFSSLELLISLGSEIRSKLNDNGNGNIDKLLAERGYDAEIIHALFRAFKPYSEKFIGENYMPPYAIFSNVRSCIPQNKTGLIFDYLDRLVNAHAVLRFPKGGEGTYSLNPHLNEITDPVIRKVASFYLIKRH